MRGVATDLKVRRPGWIVILILMLSALSQPALADWRKAESPHFIVYSDGSERALREFTRKLEVYDFFLRTRFGTPSDGPYRKLPVYLIGGSQAMQQIRPDIATRVAGIYTPGGEDIYAVAIRNQGDDFLLHEYFHHFSFQSKAATGFPAWLVEGLAEYYATADIEDDTVRIGDHNPGRTNPIVNGNWIALEDLVSKPYGEIRPGIARDTYYPAAWLLTHWFLSDPEHAGWLQAYVTDYQTGTPSAAAIQKATGLTLAQLRGQLQTYLTSRLQITDWEINAPPVEITLTLLPLATGDLLLLGQRLKSGVRDESRSETLQVVRRATARYPDDPFARLQRAHAELHFGGDDALGETLLGALLQEQPDNVEALQLMASRRFYQASQTPAQSITLTGQGRSYLARAYGVDPDNYYTLFLLARSRERAADYPNDNDVETWRQAFALAPQMPSIRLGLSAALMRRGEFSTAETLLIPLASSSHGGSTVAAAQTLLGQARARQSPLSDEALEAAAERERTEPPAPPPSPDGPATQPDEQPETSPETAPALPGA